MDQATRRIRRAALLRVLRRIREEENLLQTDLAATLGVPQSFVSKYETGERRLDLGDLHALADAIGVSLIDVVKRYLHELDVSER